VAQQAFAACHDFLLFEHWRQQLPRVVWAGLLPWEYPEDHQFPGGLAIDPVDEGWGNVLKWMQWQE